MTRPGNRPSGCFFLAFLLMGLAGTGLFGARMIWPVLWARLSYVETTCLVLDKRLDQHQGDDGPTFLAQIHIEYAVDNVVHRTWTYDAARVFTNVRWQHDRVLRQFETGQRYPCWYDPRQPGKAVLTRHLTLWSLMVLVPMVFVLVGAGGLIANRRNRSTEPTPPPVPTLTGQGFRPMAGVTAMFFGGFIVSMILSFTLVFQFAAGGPFWLAPILFFGPFVVYCIVCSIVFPRMLARLKRTMPSPERSAALHTTPGAEDAAVQVWPTIPKLASPPRPGQTLAYRLDSSSHPVGFFLISLGVAAFWNGIVSVFLYSVVDGHVQGNPNWGPTLFLIPFVLVGLVLLVVVLAAVVGLLSSLLTGRVRIEVASHPLLPGQGVEFLVEQSGLAPLHRVRLSLICTESASYTAGTSTSKATKDVVEAEVAGPEASLAGGLRGKLAAPTDAMHSFEAVHNAITWKLRITGRAGGLLPYSAEYPVIVHPEV